MEVRIELIEMPEASEVRAVSAMRREQLAQEHQAQLDHEEQRATDDLPRFIKFINRKIDEAKMNGLTSVEISFNSEQWAITDPRCEFTFKGSPNYKHMDFIEKLYKSLGFKGYARTIVCNTRLAYRDGEVYISW